MEIKKGLLFVTIAALGAVAISTGIVANQSNDLLKTFNAKASQEVVDLTTKTINRRIWIVNEDDWGWSKLYAHVWLVSDNKVVKDVEVTNWVDFTGEDIYWHGIAYVDVEFAGAGDSIGVILKNSADWSGTQTGDNILPALSSTSGDVVFLQSGLTDNKRNSDVKSAGMSTGQLAKVLNTINTCTNSYASGYNAYPQLNKDFFIPSQGQIDQYGTATIISDLDKDSHDGYNLKNKIDKLEELYESEGWTIA